MSPCNIRQQQLRQGEHLKKKRKLWAPTWPSEAGWCPEAGSSNLVSRRHHPANSGAPVVDGFRMGLLEIFD